MDPNAGPPADPGSSQQLTDSWATGWLKKDGTFDHTAFDRAPDDLKPLRKEVERYKSVDEYLKGQSAREALIGRKGLFDALPKDATTEQKAERVALVRKALGAPEKMEGYVLAKPESVPAEQWNQEAVNAAAKIAFEEGVPPAALQKFAELQMSLAQGSEQAHVKAQETADKAWYDGQDKLIRELATKEGTDFVKVMENAERAGAKWGVAKDNPLMKNATVVALLNRLAKAGAEDSLVTGKTENLQDLAGMTPESALAKANDIRDNPSNPKYEAYWQKKGPHADHDKVVAEVSRYTALAYKDRPTRTTRAS